MFEYSCTCATLSMRLRFLNRVALIVLRSFFLVLIAGKTRAAHTHTSLHTMELPCTHGKAASRFSSQRNKSIRKHQTQQDDVGKETCLCAADMIVCIAQQSLLVCIANRRCALP